MKEQIRARRSTPEARAKALAYYHANPRCRILARERQQSPEAKFKRVLAKYKMRLADFDQMIAAQGNRCASCGDELKSGLRRHIDHDHKTGQVRGILCNGCNSAEGFLRGCPLRARKLATYMERSASPLLLDATSRDRAG